MKKDTEKYGLTDLIETIEKQYARSNIPFLIGSGFGAGSVHALFNGNYETAVVESLIVAGFFLYGAKKRKEYREYKNELIDSHTRQTSEKIIKDLKNEVVNEVKK